LALAPLTGCATTGAGARAVALPEDQALAAFVTARVQALEGDPAAAVAPFAAALAASGNAREVAELALANALSAGDFGAARQVLGALPESAEPLVELARGAELFRAGRFEEARLRMQGVQGDASQRVIADLLSIWALSAQQRHGEALAALEALEQAVRPAGLSALALDQRGLVLLRAGDAAAAEEAFAAGDPPLIRTGAVDLARAAGLVRLGRAPAAAALLQSRMDRAYDPVVEQALARLRAGKKLPLRPQPGQGLASGVAAFAAALSGDDPGVSYTPYLALALGAAPAAEDVRLVLADAQRRLERPRSAALALEAITEESPYHRPAALRRAALLLEGGQAEEGLTLARAIAADGAEYALAALADLLRQAERWAEAEAVYDRLLAQAQRPNWRLYFLRGAVRERQGRWPAAETDLQEAAALAPEQADVLNYLGYGWADRGLRLNEAITLLERAIRMQPRAAHIQDSLGWAYFKAGRKEEARYHLERAVVLDPQDPTASEHLGDLYRDLGRLSEARRYWRSALAAAETEADKARVQDKLSMAEAAEAQP
jgi:tetratricopeptide (TPR) repeat protein